MVDDTTAPGTARTARTAQDEAAAGPRSPQAQAGPPEREPTERTEPTETDAPARRPRRRRWGYLVAAALVVVVAAGGYLLRGSSPVGYWRSAAGLDEYTAAYADSLATMPVPSATDDVRTSFGVVRSYTFDGGGDPDTPPIVLLPGRTGAVAMWSENLEGFLDGRDVIALDAIGDAGMSVQTRAIAGDADQAAWVEEALAGLDLDRVHLVGHSFGAWTAANHAVHHPERIASLTLLEPVYVFDEIPLGTVLRTIPASIPFLPQSWRDAMLEELGGGPIEDPDDPIVRSIAAGTEHYALQLPLPGLIEGPELAGLPVYVALAPDSVMHDVDDAASAARETVPDADVQVWPDTTHSLPMELVGEIEPVVLEFVGAHD